MTHLDIDSRIHLINRKTFVKCTDFRYRVGMPDGRVCTEWLTPTPEQLLKAISAQRKATNTNESIGRNLITLLARNQKPTVRIELDWKDDEGSEIYTHSRNKNGTAKEIAK